MTVFSVLTLCGGLAFFLYGMHVMSGGLEKISGGKLENALKKMTSNPVKSLALGMFITVAIQSSSAVTVMLVGLVNSGIMQMGQTIGVIMGSNIGTTLTAWILSLAGIESQSIWLNLLKPENFSPVLALMGVLFIMLSKTTKKKDIGGILVGFSVLMFGMELMGNAVAPLANVPEFDEVLVYFNNPILGVLVGAVFTGIIQSSAASVGILQALSQTGLISFGMAIPVIMGQNIGTCVTALISSIGVNKNAKRVAAVHMSFNIIGTVVCLLLFYGYNAIFGIKFINNIISPFGIAIAHSIFNVFTTFLLVPFSKQLEWLACRIVRDRQEVQTISFLDERLLETPSVAVGESDNMTVRMGRIAQGSIEDALTLCDAYNENTADKVRASETELDEFEDRLGTYLLKISGKELSDTDSRRVSKMLHVIGNFERMGDHALNLVDAAKEINSKNITFSDEARGDLERITAALREILELTITAYQNRDYAAAKSVEPLEQVIDRLVENARSAHIERLRSGNCSIETGFVLSDLLTDVERISDHCSNVAVAMLEVQHDSFQTHDYLNGVKKGGNEAFEAEYLKYGEKYNIL